MSEEDYNDLETELEKASQYQKETFPNVTTEEITFYLEVVGKLGSKVSGKELGEQLEGNPLFNFLSAVGKASSESKAYQGLISNLKMALVMANRTTGLTNAYLAGVAIGYFLAKPESLPEDSVDASGSVS